MLSGALGQTRGSRRVPCRLSRRVAFVPSPEAERLSLSSPPKFRAYRRLREKPHTKTKSTAAREGERARRRGWIVADGMGRMGGLGAEQSA